MSWGQFFWFFDVFLVEKFPYLHNGTFARSWSHDIGYLWTHTDDWRRMYSGLQQRKNVTCTNIPHLSPDTSDVLAMHKYSSSLEFTSVLVYMSLNNFKDTSVLVVLWFAMVHMSSNTFGASVPQQNQYLCCIQTCTSNAYKILQYIFLHKPTHVQLSTEDLYKIIWYIWLHEAICVQKSTEALYKTTPYKPTWQNSYNDQINWPFVTPFFLGGHGMGLPSFRIFYWIYWVDHMAIYISVWSVLQVPI